MYPVAALAAHKPRYEPSATSALKTVQWRHPAAATTQTRQPGWQRLLSSSSSALLHSHSCAGASRVLPTMYPVAALTQHPPQSEPLTISALRIVHPSAKQQQHAAHCAALFFAQTLAQEHLRSANNVFGHCIHTTHTVTNADASGCS
jgi:hypothetical protein